MLSFLPEVLLIGESILPQVLQISLLVVPLPDLPQQDMMQISLI
jgi:hypothetical protein